LVATQSNPEPAAGSSIPEHRRSGGHVLYYGACLSIREQRTTLSATDRDGELPLTFSPWPFLHFTFDRNQDQPGKLESLSPSRFLAQDEARRRTQEVWLSINEREKQSRMRRQTATRCLHEQMVVALLGIRRWPRSWSLRSAHKGHCASDDTATLYSVGITRCTFVDHSRGLLNYQRTPYRLISKSGPCSARSGIPPRCARRSRSNSWATPVVQSGAIPQ